MDADLDYSLVLEDEFDALCLDVNDVRADTTSSDKHTKYPGKLHARRVAAELGCDSGLIYLPGMPERLLEDSDQPQPFRQRRYFFYLAGADFPDCHVTYDVAADRLVLWIPYVEPREVLWYGSKPSAAECMRRYDVDEARYDNQLGTYLARWTAANRDSTVFALHGDQAPPATMMSGAGLAVDRLNVSRLRPAMDRARVVKTDYEVAMVRRANAVSSAGHRKVAQLLRRLTSERDVEAIFAAVCTARGTRDMAYPIIAGAGENGSTLHYGANDQTLIGKETMVLDAGCEWRAYASDVTRTLPLTGGAWTPRAAAVHAIVERMQDRCIAGVAPGARFDRLHMLAEDVAVDGLLRLGVLRGDRDAVLAAGTVAAFFPHYLGHHVGLEVHDVSGALPIPAAAAQSLGLGGGKRAMVTPRDVVRMREDRAAEERGQASARSRERQKLRPNMIVTVEPGIYFCRPYLEGYFLDDPVHARFIDANVLEGYYAVGGVRIEDCILVTRDGHENLTSAPKGDELLDVINGRSK